MPARTRKALFVVAIAAAGVALLRVLAFNVAAVHQRDALALHDFMSLDRPLTHGLAEVVAHAASPVEFGLIGAVLIALAIMRERRELALGVVVILLGSAFTTDYILKPALAAPRFAPVLGFQQIDGAAFPSGHATGAMALALSAVLVAGPRLRPAVAGLGVLFALAVSYSLLSLGWHYPSDVLGGYLVAMGWTGAVVAVLSWREAPRPALAKFDWRPSLGLLLVVLVAALGILLALSPDHSITYVRDHKVFAAAAGAIAAAGLAVAGGLALILNDRPD
jgi:membrane-associated phospholipid phosphatase